MVILFILISIFICTVMYITVFTSYGYTEIDQILLSTVERYGDTTMTIDDDGSFSCEWQDINNAYLKR